MYAIRSYYAGLEPGGQRVGHRETRERRDQTVLFDRDQTLGGQTRDEVGVEAPGVEDARRIEHRLEPPRNNFV